MVILAWTAIAAAGLSSLILWTRYRPRKADDLGVVSTQWLAEHRLGRWGSEP